MKTFRYFGVLVLVPDWTQAMAVDYDGALYAFKVPPKAQRFGLWTPENKPTKVSDTRYLVSFIDDLGPCPFWDKSLVTL